MDLLTYSEIPIAYIYTADYPVLTRVHILNSSYKISLTQRVRFSNYHYISNLEIHTSYSSLLRVNHGWSLVVYYYHLVFVGWILNVRKMQKS